MVKKEILFLLIITCAVVLFWVASNVWHDRANVALSPELQTAMQPLKPDFDQATLSKIKSLPSP